VSGNVNSASDVEKKIIVVKNKPRRDALLVNGEQRPTGIIAELCGLTRSSTSQLVREKAKVKNPPIFSRWWFI
jgi:hypothetical protein